MGKLKSTLTEVKADLTTTAVRLASGDLSVLTRSDRILLVITTGLMIAFYASTTVFAAPTIFDNIKDKFSTYYGSLVGIATVIAAVCIIAGLLWTMLSPGQKSAATPISWIKKVILCYFLVLVLGGIFGIIRDVAGDYLTWDPGSVD